MKKIFIAATALTLMCGVAFAQGTSGPAAQQDNMTKPGMNNGTMEKGAMDKGSMNTGTTGMNKDNMSKEGMPKDGTKEMSKDGAPANNPMKKDGMSK
jgi:pentapeptide MXKDX repeat protein